MTHHLPSPFIRFAFPVYILLLSLLTFILSGYPGHNGDMPFYIACAIEKDQGSMKGVVEQTREILKNELPAGEYIVHEARISQASEVLFEFYRVKPFYILLVLFFHKLGFQYTHATVIPSLIGYFLIGLSIWRFAIQLLDPFKTFLVSLFCMIIYPTLVLARLSTPDAISCFFMLNALLLIYSGRNKNLWFCLFLLAICTRIDNVIAELIFLFALWKWPDSLFPNKLTMKEFIGMTLILVCFALLVNGTATHQFFWFKDPYFTRPAGQYQKDLSNYFFVIPGSFFIYLVLFFIFSGFSRGFNWKQKVNYLFYVVCAVVFVRFLLYPYYEERFFTALLLFSLLTIFFYHYGVEKKPLKAVTV
jgi:hypothetical protein